MLRKLLALVVGIAAVSSFALAADDKPIEGKLVCTKCTLGETEKCGQALKVKDGDKETVYYIKDKGGAEKYHKAVCPAGTEKDAKVTGGKVVEKDGKKWIEGGKVELAK